MRRCEEQFDTLGNKIYTCSPSEHYDITNDESFQSLLRPLAANCTGDLEIHWFLPHMPDIMLVECLVGKKYKHYGGSKWTCSFLSPRSPESFSCILTLAFPTELEKFFVVKSRTSGFLTLCHETSDLSVANKRFVSGHSVQDSPALQFAVLSFSR